MPSGRVDRRQANSRQAPSIMAARSQTQKALPTKVLPTGNGALLSVRGDGRAGQVGIVAGAALIHPCMIKPSMRQRRCRCCFDLSTA